MHREFEYDRALLLDHMEGSLSNGDLSGLYWDIERQRTGMVIPRCLGSLQCTLRLSTLTAASNGL